MISLPQLAERLQDAELLNKSFMNMTKSEILELVTAVYSCPGDEVPPAGWTPPSIEKGAIRIPFDSHPKYHWWALDGQSVLETLIELNAPWTVAKAYLDGKGVYGMTEEAYVNKLIPF